MGFLNGMRDRYSLWKWKRETGGTYNYGRPKKGSIYEGYGRRKMKRRRTFRRRSRRYGRSRNFFYD